MDRMGNQSKSTDIMLVNPSISISMSSSSRRFTGSLSDNKHQHTISALAKTIKLL